MIIEKKAEEKELLRVVHKAVLKKEVFRCLEPKPNENFIDATAGEGGYIFGLLEGNKPKGMVLGIEWDGELYQKLKIFSVSKITPRTLKRLILINDSYANLKEIIEKINFNPVNGILLDLGMSSWHLEKSGRGFSFLKDEPLDMRYNAKNQKSKIKNQNDKSKFNNDLTAERIVNQYSQKEIEKILKEYGEEKFAKRIAKAIVEQRKKKPFKTTFQLIEVIGRTARIKRQKTKIHFAARIFQSLRIAVNNELGNLKKVLPQAVEILAPGGRIAIISFHSLEDRIVKNFFKNNLSLKILTKKPIRPTQEEIKINFRSRSAKLRAAQKI